MGAVVDSQGQGRIWGDRALVYSLDNLLPMRMVKRIQVK